MTKTFLSKNKLPIVDSDFAEVVAKYYEVKKTLERLKPLHYREKKRIDLYAYYNLRRKYNGM